MGNSGKSNRMLINSRARIPFLGVTILGFLSIFLLLTTCKRFEPVGFLHVNTGSVSQITSRSASAGGEVTDEGGNAVTARGVCWSTSNEPTISGNKTTDGSGRGSYTSSLTGLSPGTTYFVRAYATNSDGTTYGEEQRFTTASLQMPTITTIEVTAITENSARSGGEVTDDGGATVTARGVCWATTANPTISGTKTTDGTGTGSFTSNITGLAPSTTYYVRAYATNSSGTSYGNEVSFATSTSSGETVTDIDR